jgi:hypothetical protein
MKFIFKNQEFEYFIHPYNRTNETERKVEIPLVKSYIEQANDFIEIGCVSPYYFEVSHNVYDLTDNHHKCINIDAEKLDLDNKNILSISTIEHFGVVDSFSNEKKQNKAIDFLKRILSLNSKYLISWPLGYNLELDQYTFSNIKNALYISRDNNNLLTWKQKTLNQLNDTDKRYGTFDCANTVCILENFL